MIRKTPLAARRSFLLCAVAAGMALAAPAVARDPAPVTGAVVDPWMGRDLTSSEKIRLNTLGDELNASLRGSGLRVERLKDHLRLRIPAGMAYRSSKDALSPEGVAYLTLVAEAMSRQKRVRVEIVGHHDARPSDYEAYVFSQRRAQSALATLYSRGIDVSRIRATGLGLKFPYTAPATSGENQRIELLFRPL